MVQFDADFKNVLAQTCTVCKDSIKICFTEVVQKQHEHVIALSHPNRSQTSNLFHNCGSGAKKSNAAEYSFIFIVYKDVGHMVHTNANWTKLLVFACTMRKTFPLTSITS